MDIMKIGPWILLLIGAGALVLAITNSLKGGMTKNKRWLWIFGLTLCGAGIWGPQFFSPYSEFIRTISGLYATDSERTVSDALSGIGDGDMPLQFADLTLRYILSRPPDGIDTVLERCAKEAADSSGKEILLNAGAVFRGMKNSASLVLKALRAAGNAETLIEGLDPAMRRLVAVEIMSLPDSLRIVIGISDAKLAEMSPGKSIITGSAAIK